MGDGCECCGRNEDQTTQYNNSLPSNFTGTTVDIWNSTTTPGLLSNITAFTNTTSFANSTIPFNHTLYGNITTTFASNVVANLTTADSTPTINCSFNSTTEGFISTTALEYGSPNSTSSDDNLIGLIIGLILQLLSFFPCLFGNLSVFIAFVKYNKLRTKTNFYIVNLTVADFLVGILVVPFDSTEKIYEITRLNSAANESLPRDPVFCTIHRFIITFLMGYSLVALLMISIDRYIAVARPFYYVEKVTSKGILITIGISWLLMFALCAPILDRLGDIGEPFYRVCGFPCWSSLKSQGKAYVIILYILLVIIYFSNIACYAWVAAIAVKQHLKLKDLTQRNVIYSKGDIRNTKIMTSMFGIFILFWLPYMLILTLHVVGTCSKNTCIIPRDIALSLGVVNSSINCYIYAWRKRDIKEVLSMMLCSRKRVRVVPQDSAQAMRRANRNNSSESAYNFTARLSHRPTELSLMASCHSSVVGLDNLEMSCSVDMSCYNAENSNNIESRNKDICQCEQQPSTATIEPNDVSSGTGDNPISIT